MIVETDGCFVDGIEVATGATVGHRTLRVNDYGKIAATFVDVARAAHCAYRPKLTPGRGLAGFAPAAASRYAAQLEGYRAPSRRRTLRIPVRHPTPPLEDLLSRPDLRVNCEPVRRGDLQWARSRGRRYRSLSIVRRWVATTRSSPDPVDCCSKHHS